MDRTWGRRNPLLFGAIAFVFLALGFLLGRGSADEPPTQVPEAAPPSSDTTEPIETPLEAATRYGRILTGPSGDVDTYLAEMDALAAPEWADRAAELAANGVDFVEERYGPGGSVEFHPVKYRIESESASEATVEIWGVVLGSGPNVNGVEETWGTGTLDLVLVDSEWKVTGQASVGGPTPELLRAEDAFSITRILQDFQDYSDAPDS